MAADELRNPGECLVSPNNLDSFALFLVDKEVNATADTGSRLSECDTLAGIIKWINAPTLHGKPKVHILL